MSVPIKLCLQYGKNHAKLVGFKEQKEYFAFLKPVNLAQYLPYCKHSFIGIGIK
jgi:hypothetical protein